MVQRITDYLKAGYYQLSLLMFLLTHLSSSSDEDTEFFRIQAASESRIIATVMAASVLCPIKFQLKSWQMHTLHIVLNRDRTGSSTVSLKKLHKFWEFTDPASIPSFNKMCC